MQFERLCIPRNLTLIMLQKDKHVPNAKRKFQPIKMRLWLSLLQTDSPYVPNDVRVNLYWLCVSAPPYRLCVSAPPYRLCVSAGPCGLLAPAGLDP